ILIGKATRARVSSAADATARLAGHLGEMVAALGVLTAFRRAQAQTAAVERVSATHRRGVLATLRLAFASALSLELIASLSIAVVAVDIGVRLVEGSLDLRTGLLVLILAPECYLPLRAAGAAFHASEDGLEAVRRVAEITEDVGAQPELGPNGVQPAPVAHQLALHGLRVTRRGGDAPDGWDLQVPPGRITRLRGQSGAGKSTVFAVLLGFVTPSAGRVTVDGTELASLDLAEWRRQVAYLPQRPRFAADTVAGELRDCLADRGVTPDRHAMIHALSQADADGLLGARLAELSAGQRQRIALARAFLRVEHGATVLLLDEPTAHLDPLACSTILWQIKAFAAAGTTVLLAMHRVAEQAEPGGRATEPRRAEPTGPRRSPRPARGAWRAVLSYRLLVGTAVGALAAAAGIALTVLAAWLIARAAQQPPILTLTVAMVGVRTFGLGKAVLRYLERLLTHDAAFAVAGRLRAALWQGLVRIGPARAAALRAGEGASRMVADTDTVRDLLPRVLAPPLVAAVVLATALTVQFLILPAAGLALLAAAALAAVLAPLLALWVDRRATLGLARGRREVSAGVHTLLGASADLLACGAAEQRRRRLARMDAALRTRAHRSAFAAGSSSALSTLALGLASAAGALYGLRAGVAPVLVPVLALLPLALLEVLDPLTTAVLRRTQLREAIGRLAELTSAPRQQVSIGLTHRSGEIELRGVTVGWPGAPAPVLREVSVGVPAGSHVAVLGPSGAGKSTLLALLLGFLAPTRGSAVVPARVALSAQDPSLVSTTLRENLRLGNPHAGDTELAEVLRAVSLGEFVATLDEPLGANGSAVSGGEAARLSVARALLALPGSELLVLDEPTAHLDAPTADAVLAEIIERCAGITLVHVTHRAAEAELADIVLQVRDGTVTVRRGSGPSPAVAPPLVSAKRTTARRATPTTGGMVSSAGR
ncbi:MAG: thiol reductant ABC exporter subunit CydC, partial [Sciscionella sp.]